MTDIKNKKYEIYLLAQTSGFTGTYEEWLDSIKGDSVVITVIEGKLKWKYSNESDYKELLEKVLKFANTDDNRIYIKQFAYATYNNKIDNEEKKVN